MPKKIAIESRKTVSVIYYPLCHNYTVGTGSDAAFCTLVHYSVPWLITLFLLFLFQTEFPCFVIPPTFISASMF